MQMKPNMLRSVIVVWESELYTFFSRYWFRYLIKIEIIGMEKLFSTLSFTSENCEYQFKDFLVEIQGIFIVNPASTVYEL